MEIREREERRADNLIWNAAGDYSLIPWMRVFDADGRAELYWNSIIGAIFRRFDREALRLFSERFGRDDDRMMLETVFWLALENAVLAGELARRPALRALRRRYAQAIMDRPAAKDARVTAFFRAWFAPELGQIYPLPSSDQSLLEAVREIRGEDTGALLEQIETLLRERLEFIPYIPGKAKPTAKGFFLRLLGKDPNAMNQLAPVRGFALGMAEHLRPGEGESEEEARKALRLPRPTATRDIDMREYVRGYFGPSMLDEREVLAMERTCCVGHHQDCHLHLTRGAAGDSSPVRGYAGERRLAALAQEKVNRDAYRQDLARNRAAIQRLTQRLRNSTLSRLDRTPVRVSAGKLDAGRVWKAMTMGEEKIFTRDQREEPGALSVDILLDASTSQLPRQTAVAAQGYIIAESLTRCRIPVRVCSFCSMNGFTVLHMFRDYQETDANENIFRYFTAGCNRDGLAVRTMASIMQQSHAEHRILIVLSDAKPNDVMKVRTKGSEYREYIEDEGIGDTAAEVHNARVHDIQVVCVFTGTDADLPAAKRIYGQHMARIRSISQFADTVAGLLQAQIAEI